MTVVDFKKGPDYIYRERPAGYILDNNKCIKAVWDIIEWAKAFERDDRIVAQTNIGDSFISIVFLGLDHQYGAGPPLLFETLVFGGPLAGEQERYATWNEALRGHADMLHLVRGVRMGQYATLIGTFFCFAAVGINPIWFYLGYGAGKMWMKYHEA